MAFTMSFEKYSALQNRLGGMGYNQLLADFNRGNVTLNELKQFYSRSRDTVIKREKAAIKAGLKRGAPEDFAKVKELKSAGDVLHAIAEANRYLAGKTTITERKQTRDQAINTMHSRGMFQFVNKNNYAKFVQVMEWVKSAGLLKSYSSESDVVEDFVEEAIDSKAATAADFESLFWEIADGAF